MPDLWYVALKRLSPLYNEKGEPFSLEPGEYIPDELIEAWGDYGVTLAVDVGNIGLLPVMSDQELLTEVDRRGLAPAFKRARATATQAKT